MLQTIDDITLAKARQGDSQAWKRIYRACERPMYSLALQLVGEPATAEDLVQDTFIKVMEKIHLYRGESNFWWWLKRVHSNQCISYLRRQNRWVQIDESSLTQMLDTIGSVDDDGVRRDMAKLMAKLPEQARQVVYLYVVEGFSHEEIAQLFDQSISFSKSLVSRSLAKLRQWINH